ncbi:MAG: hypothetical protein U0X73_18765 [Thermoanaerobaculia bacterium]
MRSSFRAGTCAFALLAVATAASALQGPISINGNGPALAGFTLVINETASCGLDFLGSVTTDAGGGNDTFTISVTDEGAIVASQDFSFPADGAAHPIQFSFSMQHVFVNNDWGLVVEDPGGLGHFEIPDLFVISSCSLQNIPTLSGVGTAAFAFLLATAGALALLRRRG